VEGVLVVKEWQYNLIIIALCIISIAAPCIIATSDLPDWIKFWLLSK